MKVRPVKSQITRAITAITMNSHRNVLAAPALVAPAPRAPKAYARIEMTKKMIAIQSRNHIEKLLSAGPDGDPRCTPPYHRYRQRGGAKAVPPRPGSL